MTRRTAGARRKPAVCATPSAASSSGGLIRVSNPELARLALLERQHERLLRDIAKRRASLETMRAAADQVLGDVYAQIAPLREEIESTVRAVRQLFEDLLAREASRSTQRTVRQVYQDVLESLPWELLVATQPEQEAEVPAPESGRRARSARVEEEEPFLGGAFKPGKDDEAGYSAALPDDHGSGGLRALFKRLVTRLHPDKVQDTRAKAERTLAMKEVTQAYQAGDLARLLEIERTLAEDLLNEVKSSEVAQRVRRLISANEALRVQLRTLTRERKELRDSLPFQFDLRAPRRLREQAQAQARDIVAGAEEELAHYQSIREFVERYARGKMSVRDFALGPQGTAPWDGDALLEAMLDELLANDAVMHQRAGKRRR